MNRTTRNLLSLLRSASVRQLEESNAWFAKQLGVTPRTVNRAIAELVKLGHIEVEHSRASGPGITARVIKVNANAIEVAILAKFEAEVTQ